MKPIAHLFASSVVGAFFAACFALGILAGLTSLFLIAGCINPTPPVEFAPASQQTGPIAPYQVKP